MNNPVDGTFQNRGLGFQRDSPYKHVSLVGNRPRAHKFSITSKMSAVSK